MANDYDVIVAGCGPAGSVCGRVLAASGLRVLAVDRSEFPRDKLCGGLLTWKSMQLLQRLTGLCARDLCLAGIVDHATPDYLIRYRGKPLTGGRTEYPFHFVKRRVLDAFLLNRAREAGLALALGREVRAVREVDGAGGPSATVSLDDGRVLRAGWIVGADGVNSLVRRSFPLPAATWRRNLGQAVEVHVAHEAVRALPGAHEDLGRGRAVLYAGFLRAGYAWVLPNSDCVAVGLGGLIRSNGNAFKSIFMEFLRFLGLPEALADRARAHPIPYGNYLRRPARGRVLLCGDAAGLVEPFFGEGIYYAMRSGELAARAVLAHAADPGAVARAYACALEAHVLREFDASMRLRAPLYSCVRMSWIAPIAVFLGLGGNRLLEMVHGRRSFRFLRPLPADPWVE
ncbi:MAG: geranylgeranyl reductase family protein [Desulfovibrionaceae bacterium]|nr:geranylgeranyl reductase family protein [Desulfovibrionaceae bacterium]MBF0515001.1 geranylgeranyl reductase family protein [Desulfovibrionaceae bacterium]